MNGRLKKINALLNEFPGKQKILFLAGLLILATAAAVFAQSAGNGLRLNFLGAPLQQILDYLSNAGGFVVQVQPEVDTQTKFFLSSDKKLTADEAVAMLKQALSGSGYTVTQNGQLLTISASGPRPAATGTTDAARTATAATAVANDTTATAVDADMNGATSTPAATHPFVRWDLIPDDPSPATYIIAIRNADAGVIATNLETLDLPGTEMTNDPADSITIAGPQFNARRVARIVSALDSPNLRGGVIESFAIRNVDARALGNVVKILAPARLARPGVTMKSVSDRLLAIADPQSNLLFVNTPDMLQSSVESVVLMADRDPIGELSQQTFHLEQADADEVALFFSSLFPNGAPAGAPANDESSSPTGAVEPSGRAPQGRTGVVAARGGRRPALILAVPNRQAGILIVSAPRQLMPMVSAMIQQLDANAASGITRGLASPGFGGEPAEVQRVLNRVFPLGLYLQGAAPRIEPVPLPRAPAINTDLSNTNIERVITPH